MRETSLERLQKELQRSRHVMVPGKPSMPAKGPAPRLRTKRQAYGLSRMSFAQNPAAAASPGGIVAKLGESAIKLAIDKSDGDIHWSLEAMEGTFHPKYPKWSEKERALYGARPFARKETTFRGPVIKNPVGVETYSELMIQFQSNGYLVGEVLATPGKRNDPPGFGLNVEGKIVRNQNATGDVAEIAYQLLYTFTRTLGQDVVWYGELRIRGDGSLTQTRGEWVQFRSFPSPFSLSKPDADRTSAGDLKIAGASPPFPKWLYDRECAPSAAKALSDEDEGQEAEGQQEQYYEGQPSEKEEGDPFAMAQGAAAPWKTFFPLVAGTKYDVDGPGPYNGKGQVYDRTDTFLKFDLDMPEADVPLMGKKPKSHLIFECTYTAEGRGNVVRVTANGKLFEDKDAVIATTTKRRTIKPAITMADDKGAQQPVAMALEADGANAVSLDLMIGKNAYDFDLKPA